MSSTHQQGVLHRAIELARSGAFADWTEIAGELRLEGYQEVDAALSEQSVQDQLDLACGAARHG